MHDIFEGVANYTMVNICNNLIFKQKLFSLELLNKCLETFQYREADISNAIPVIKSEHIQVKKKLMMSSGEMISFTRFFGLFVGDKVKEENKTWELYIKFRKIIAIVTSPRIHQGHIFMLETFIYDFFTIYKSLYGNLKYKFHNMIHPPRFMSKNGPLVYYWSMRSEAKHRQLKLSSVSTSNRTNLLKTISIKSQLCMAFLKHINKVLIDVPVYDSFFSIDQLSRQKYFSNSAKDEEIISVNHADWEGLTIISIWFLLLKLMVKSSFLVKLLTFLSKIKIYFY